MGKFMVILLVLCTALAGGGLYYTQNYGFYTEVTGSDAEEVHLTSVTTGQPESILIENMQAIDATSSPQRYRACFTTPISQALLTETYDLFDNPAPLIAPSWFDCFDAQAIGEALEAGDMLAFMGTENIVYGFDRVVAIDAAGNGYVWHQINACGREVYDGNAPPPGCPERTE